MDTSTSRRRAGGRGRRVGGTQVPQLPWRQVVNPYAPVEMLSADQIESIHSTSIRILEELGIEVMSQRALWIARSSKAHCGARRRCSR
jgi:trimethylamine---corrinoid protein Co-methyltransferase